MPPKPKFERNEVINVALSIVESEGVEALTARSLGKRLGSSSRPVFTLFKDMEEVICEVINTANTLYSTYVEEGLQEQIKFKGVGKAYIRFASEHPKLFQLLFMKEREIVPDLHNVLETIEGSYDQILASITDNYGLDLKIAEEIYIHLWIYSHGIAVLIATRVCVFSEEQISNMLTDIFVSLLKRIKSEGKK